MVDHAQASHQTMAHIPGHHPCTAASLGEGLSTKHLNRDGEGTQRGVGRIILCRRWGPKQDDGMGLDDQAQPPQPPKHGLELII